MTRFSAAFVLAVGCAVSAQQPDAPPNPSKQTSQQAQVTVTGCVQAERSAATGYILSNVSNTSLGGSADTPAPNGTNAESHMPTGTSGQPSASEPTGTATGGAHPPRRSVGPDTGVNYLIEAGARDQLKANVGKRVEVVGTIVGRSTRTDVNGADTGGSNTGAAQRPGTGKSTRTSQRIRVSSIRTIGDCR